MKLELIEKREMPLLSRTRVQFLMDFEGATPSRQEVVREVAKKCGVDEKLVIIRHIYNRFGKKQAKVIANIYKTVEDMKKIEEKSALKKHLKEEKPAEADSAVT
ncbi:MAG: hypothetical protein QXG86_03675 [Candidatus Woesearchaeota archaeon]